MWKAMHKCAKNLASPHRRGLKKIVISTRVTLILALFYFVQRKQSADSMQCYAAPQRRLWESMKLVQLVFVLTNVNLNTLLVWKKPSLGPFQSLSNKTEYGCAYRAVIEPARKKQGLWFLVLSWGRAGCCLLHFQGVEEQWTIHGDPSGSENQPHREFLPWKDGLKSLSCL